MKTVEKSKAKRQARINLLIFPLGLRVNLRLMQKKYLVSILQLLVVFLVASTASRVSAQGRPLGVDVFDDVYEIKDSEIFEVKPNFALNENFLQIPVVFKRQVRLNKPLQIVEERGNIAVEVSGRIGRFQGRFFLYQSEDVIFLELSNWLSRFRSREGSREVDLWYFDGEPNSVFPDPFCILDLGNEVKLVYCGKLEAFVPSIGILGSNKMTNLLEFKSDPVRNEQVSHLLKYKITTFSIFADDRSRSADFKSSYLKYRRENLTTLYAKPYESTSHWGFGGILDIQIDDTLILNRFVPQLPNDVFEFLEFSQKFRINHLPNGRFSLDRINENQPSQ
ncbi:MAG: hypothetical protein AAB680_06760 [Pseudomonadota bacterium]